MFVEYNFEVSLPWYHSRVMTTLEAKPVLCMWVRRM
jgi:hypothetical protein